MKIFVGVIGVALIFVGVILLFGFTDKVPTLIPIVLIVVGLTFFIWALRPSGSLRRFGDVWPPKGGYPGAHGQNIQPY